MKILDDQHILKIYADRLRPLYKFKIIIRYEILYEIKDGINLLNGKDVHLL